MPLESPKIESFNIILDYDTLLDKWYLRKKSKDRNEEDTYVWVLKFGEFEKIQSKKSKMKEDKMGEDNAESEPVALLEKMVINTGDCYFEVKKNE